MSEPLHEVSQSLGHGGGLVVSALAFWTDDPSSIHALDTEFVRKDKNKWKKRTGLAHLKKVSQSRYMTRANLHNSATLQALFVSSFTLKSWRVFKLKTGYTAKTVQLILGFEHWMVF